MNFKELSIDGQDLELLIREILFTKGFKVYWSGRGPDGGRDLLCLEICNSLFSTYERRWLIQCKHFAHSNKSVGKDDLDEIVDSCAQHGATGYLLVCSTQPSSAVVQRLESISANLQNNITATYWDGVKIEQLLSTPRMWKLAQRFFPISAEAEKWDVYATERPNHWVVNYKGYYFHLSNRIGSYREHHLESLSKRISEIESIQLPTEHFIRIRSVYYDDKNGNYTWHLDYMYPNDQRPAWGTQQIAHALSDGYAFEDGQIYHFDVKHLSYFKHSDHYDPDHYNYYEQYVGRSFHGFERDKSYDDYIEENNSRSALVQSLEEQRDAAFNRLVEKFKSLDFVKLLRSCNAQVEHLDRFHLQRNWSEVIEELDIETDRFFSAWFFIQVTDDLKFHRLMEYLPQDFGQSFRLTKPIIYIPSEETNRNERSDDGRKQMYELTVSIYSDVMGSKHNVRKLLNEYFEALIGGIDLFSSEERR